MNRKIKLICKLGDNGDKIVEVNETDRLSVFMDLLNLKDKNTKFIFNERTYPVCTNQTFKDIELTKDNTLLYFINQAISG
jgi:hypothetical protein